MPEFEKIDSQKKVPSPSGDAAAEASPGSLLSPKTSLQSEAFEYSPRQRKPFKTTKPPHKQRRHYNKYQRTPRVKNGKSKSISPKGDKEPISLDKSNRKARDSSLMGRIKSFILSLFKESAKENTSSQTPSPSRRRGRSPRRLKNGEQQSRERRGSGQRRKRSLNRRGGKANRVNRTTRSGHSPKDDKPQSQVNRRKQPRQNRKSRSPSTKQNWKD